MDLKPKPLAGYARCSTSEQAQSGLGLEAQRAALGAYAESAGAELVLFEDAGCSGSRRVGRPALARLLAEAAAGRFAAVVVARLDRLARSTRDALDLAAELEAASVELRDLSCPMALRGATGRLTYGMRALIAAYERDLIAERTSAALAALKTRGAWTGGRPAYGLRQNGAELEADPARFATVQMIRELRAAGLSLRSIAAALLAAGIPTARGGRWGAETVRKLLVNPRLPAAVA